jgi:hypothetical protein
MNREDVIRMAREASADKDDQNIFFDLTVDELEAFAKLIAQHEREACAQFIETGYVRQFENPWRDDLSAAIRARGQA